MRTSALFRAKNFGYFLKSDKGDEPVETLCGQRINFLRFCADVFFGQPLTLFAVTNLRSFKSC